MHRNIVTFRENFNLQNDLKSCLIKLFNCLVFKTLINIFFGMWKVQFSQTLLAIRKRTIWRDFLRVSKAFLSATRQSQRINFHLPVKFKIFNEKYLPRVYRLKIRDDHFKIMVETVFFTGRLIITLSVGLSFGLKSPNMTAFHRLQFCAI